MRIRDAAVRRRQTLYLAAGAAALLAPTAIADAASAATLHVNKACYVVTGKRPPVMFVTGSGFSPGATVSISSGKAAIANAAATADGAGNIAVPMGIVPVKTTVIPQTTTLTASDGSISATTKATVTYRAAYHGATRKRPGLQALTERTKWQFSGFIPGRSIWGHYTIGRHQVARQKFGKAKGACGTLTTRRPLYPGTPHRSSYPVQFDQAKKYSRKAKVRVTGRVSLTTEF